MTTAAPVVGDPSPRDLLLQPGPLFDRLAERYDAWYDGPVGRVVFPAEVACLAVEGEVQEAGFVGWLAVGV